MPVTARPLADLLWIAAAPLIWLIHLTSVYSAEAVICAGILPVQLSVEPVVAVFTIVAIVGLATAAAVAARGGWTNPSPVERSIVWLRPASLLLSALSAVGVIWTSLPSFLLPGCAPAAGPALAGLLAMARL